MTSKSIGRFNAKPDKSGRVRLTKVYGAGLDASKRIRMKKSKRVRVTKTLKGFQRP